MKIENKLQKETAEDIVGVEVIIYDSLEREIEKIIAIDRSDYDNFDYNLNNHTHNYLTSNELGSIIHEMANEAFSESINNYEDVVFTLGDDGGLYIKYGEE